MRALPRFPATMRDLAMIVDDRVAAQTALDFVKGLGQSLIEKVEIFDVYKGAPISQGKKSMALRFTYRSSEGSLTDAEVNAAHEELVVQLQPKLPAVVR